MSWLAAGCLSSLILLSDEGSVCIGRRPQQSRVLPDAICADGESPVEHEVGRVEVPTNFSVCYALSLF